MAFQSEWIVWAKARRPETMWLFFLILSLEDFFIGNLSFLCLWKKVLTKWWGAWVRGWSSPSLPPLAGSFHSGYWGGYSLNCQSSCLDSLMGWGMWQRARLTRWFPPEIHLYSIRDTRKKQGWNLSSSWGSLRKTMYLVLLPRRPEQSGLYSFGN